MAAMAIRRYEAAQSLLRVSRLNYKFCADAA